MKLTKDFFDQSIFQKLFYDLFFDSDIEDSKDLFLEICTISIDSQKKLTHTILQVITNINEHKFQEVRVNSLRTYHFDVGLNEIIISKYKTIKSLLTGLIITSSIIRESEIKDYQKKWENTFESNNHYYNNDPDHQKIYSEFKEIRTMNELLNFNAYFKEFILQMLLALSDEILARMKYTFQELKADQAFNNFTKELKLLSEKFGTEIAEVKRELKI